MTTLRRRLFVAVTAAILASVALTVAIGALLAHRTASQNTAAGIARRADVLAVQEQQQPTYIEEDYTSDTVRVIVKRRPKMEALLPDGRSVDRASDGKLTLDGRRYLYSYRPIGARGLIVLRSADLGSGVWGDLVRDLALAGLVGTAAAALISYFLAGSIVRPIGRVAQASRALAEGTSPKPLPAEGSAELVALARAFNDMAEQLAASRESERRFLLSVSHELKTPLTAIQGYAEGLSDGAFTPEEAAHTILLEAKRLERLVRDLLDLARINRHEFHVRREPVDLSHVAQAVARRHEAAAREFEVALRADADEPTWVEADYDRVLQVASNLVENALRETPPGGSVTVSAQAGRLVVADTGPGLDAEDVEHAFDRFFLYDKYGRARPVGSGLGLAIVRQLTDAMGGEVAVETAPGAGATFVVDLPLALPAERPSEPSPKEGVFRA